MDTALQDQTSSSSSEVGAQLMADLFFMPQMAEATLGSVQQSRLSSQFVFQSCNLPQL